MIENYLTNYNIKSVKFIIILNNELIIHGSILYSNLIDSTPFQSSQTRNFIIEIWPLLIELFYLSLIFCLKCQNNQYRFVRSPHIMSYEINLWHPLYYFARQWLYLFLQLTITEIITVTCDFLKSVF